MPCFVIHSQNPKTSKRNSKPKTLEYVYLMHLLYNQDYLSRLLFPYYTNILMTSYWLTLIVSFFMKDFYSNKHLYTLDEYVRIF